MAHLKKSTGGHLLKNAGGHLVNDCGCSNPTVDLTVSGASGTITWCAKVWNLPTDSGVTYRVCMQPLNFYRKNNFLYSTFRFNSYFMTTVISNVYLYKVRYSINFYAAAPAYKSLALQRIAGGRKRLVNRYYPYGFLGTLKSFTNTNLVGLTNTAGSNGPFQDWHWVQYASPYTYNGPYYWGQMNIIPTTMGWATWSDYQVTNLFGSHTAGGVTYTWAKATGWPN